MRTRIDGDWVEAAGGRVDETCGEAAGAIQIESSPFGGASMSGNAREGLHETRLDMAEQKALLISGVLSA